jgi:hypothetical protein
VHSTQVPPPDQNEKNPLNGVLRHERKIALRHRSPARATLSRITHFIHNHYINISPNDPILQSARYEPPTHPTKSVHNKRRTICQTTLACTWGRQSCHHVWFYGSQLEQYHARSRNAWTCLANYSVCLPCLKYSTRSDIPQAHLLIDTSTTMELARRDLQQD